MPHWFIWRKSGCNLDRKKSQQALILMCISSISGQKLCITLKCSFHTKVTIQWIVFNSYKMWRMDVLPFYTKCSWLDFFCLNVCIFCCTKSVHIQYVSENISRKPTILWNLRLSANALWTKLLKLMTDYFKRQVPHCPIYPIYISGDVRGLQWSTLKNKSNRLVLLKLVLSVIPL